MLNAKETIRVALIALANVDSNILFSLLIGDVFGFWLFGLCNVIIGRVLYGLLIAFPCALYSLISGLLLRKLKISTSHWYGSALSALLLRDFVPRRLSTASCLRQSSPLSRAHFAHFCPHLRSLSAFALNSLVSGYVSKSL